MLTDVVFYSFLKELIDLLTLGFVTLHQADFVLQPVQPDLCATNQNMASVKECNM